MTDNFHSPMKFMDRKPAPQCYESQDGFPRPCQPRGKRIFNRCCAGLLAAASVLLMARRA
ncbi:hypothetical protein PspS04_17080 [Pseudomonas sp. S04]|nr:hypothetical protein PspS04_17080 [Pseudomonas sp. S04]QHF34452.1 hypothetical protein PspS19_17085 [Pseudomonas sp. S19]